jgi:hypothetical protein
MARGKWHVRALGGYLPSIMITLQMRERIMVMGGEYGSPSRNASARCPNQAVESRLALTFLEPNDTQPVSQQPRLIPHQAELARRGAIAAPEAAIEVTQVIEACPERDVENIVVREAQLARGVLKPQMPH